MTTSIKNPSESIAMASLSPMRRLRFTFSALATLGVAACGGGGGDPVPTAAPTTAPATAGTPAAPTPPSPAPAPASPAPAPSAPGLDGIWVELQGAPSGFGGGLLRHVLVDTSGRLWGIPNATFGSNGAQAHVLEALQGDISAAGGNVSGSFFDINTKTCGLIYTCQVSGLLTASQLTLAGAKSAFGSSLPDFSFSGARDPAYATQAALSSIAGTWDTRASLATSLSASGSVVVSASGAVSVSNIGGCAFTGQLTPVSGKGYFTLALSSVSGTCSTGVVPSQVNGVAYTVRDSTGRAYLNLMWHSTGFGRYFWGTGAATLL
jgi:hypothetical protein